MKRYIGPIILSITAIGFLFGFLMGMHHDETCLDYFKGKNNE